MPIDIDYDEGRGNLARPSCLISCNVDEDFYKATRRAWDWSQPADGDVQYETIPVVRLEALFRLCPIAGDAAPPFGGFMETCLHLHDFILPAIEFLVEQGWLEDDEGNIVVFDDETSPYTRADEIVAAHEEEDRLQINQDCMDGLDALGAHADLQWLNVDVHDLCKAEGNIGVYIDLSLLLYARDGDGVRHLAAGNPMEVGSCTNGLLASAIGAYHMPASRTTPHVGFLGAKLVLFLSSTRWPTGFRPEHKSLGNYGYDLPARGAMLKAGRAEWNAMLLPTLRQAMAHYGTLAQLTAPATRDPATVIRDIERLSQALLPDLGADRCALLYLHDLEDVLAEEYAGLVDRDIKAGKSTDEVARAIIALSKIGSSDTTKDAATGFTGDVDEMAVPKRVQVRRALATAAMATLVDDYSESVSNVQLPRADLMDLLDACFAADTVLPNAVLMATPGSKLSTLLDTSPFLASLHDQRMHMALYLGQNVAYDQDEDEVPEDLRNYLFPADQLKEILGLTWWKVDTLSVLLDLASKEIGTKFRKHDGRQVYHHEVLVAKIKVKFGQLFRALGYPKAVSKAEGITFEGFMSRVEKVVAKTMGMTTGEAAGLFDKIDELVEAAYREAAASYRINVYGANLSEKRLGAWVAADSVALTGLNDMIKELKDISSFRRKTNGFGMGAPEARSLPGFASPVSAGGGDGGGGDGGGGKRRDGRKRSEPGDRGDGTGVTIGKKVKEREARPPKIVFTYEDGTFSKGQLLFDWPGICKEVGWDAKVMCGPFCMGGAGRKHDCRNASHG